jgi:hypothetical protein
MKGSPVRVRASALKKPAGNREFSRPVSTTARSGVSTKSPLCLHLANTALEVRRAYDSPGWTRTSNPPINRRVSRRKTPDVVRREARDNRGPSPLSSPLDTVRPTFADTGLTPAGKRTRVRSKAVLVEADSPRRSCSSECFKESRAGSASSPAFREDVWPSSPPALSGDSPLMHSRRRAGPCRSRSTRKR